MHASIDGMIAGGTAGCADFREGGSAGVLRAQGGSRRAVLRPLIFGRDGGEETAEGLGISSTRDVADTGTLVANARRAGKKSHCTLVSGMREIWMKHSLLNRIAHPLHACNKKTAPRMCREANPHCGLSPIQLDPRRNIFSTSSACAGYAGTRVHDTSRY